MSIFLQPPPDASNERLIARVRSAIGQTGRITFAEFMQMALYDQDYGYYTSGRETAGAGGDFITSAALSPVFGAMVARWIAARHEEMSHPNPFDVVEMGAGKGLLCASILVHLRESHPKVYDSVRYRIIEATGLRSESAPFGRPLAEEFPGKILISDALDDLADGSITGCLISNELPDAFPVHLVTAREGSLREIYVTLGDGGFVETEGELSTTAIAEYLSRIGVILPDGYRTEVNLNAVDWMRNAARKLADGFIVTIDYGYTADRYYATERSHGTLICYYRHTYNEDPYTRVGMQDMTAHVDFTSLMDAGAQAGLVTIDFTAQREFLISQDVYGYVRENPAARRSVQSLLDPDGLGGFRVLVQRRIAR